MTDTKCDHMDRHMHPAPGNTGDGFHCSLCGKKAVCVINDLQGLVRHERVARAKAVKAAYLEAAMLIDDAAIAPADWINAELEADWQNSEAKKGLEDLSFDEAEA